MGKVFPAEGSASAKALRWETFLGEFEGQEN